MIKAVYILLAFAACSDVALLFARRRGGSGLLARLASCEGFPYAFNSLLIGAAAVMLLLA